MAGLKLVRENIALREENDRLRADLAVNARLLARQCDLAREAEAVAADCKAGCDECVRLMGRAIAGQRAAEAECEALRGRLTEYERPEHWPEGSQMRHVQDLLRCLDVARAKERLADAECERLRQAVLSQDHEIQQALGQALGYPWFKDDQTNWPGATEADGVCVDIEVEPLADEAAARIVALETECEQLRVLLKEVGSGE